MASAICAPTSRSVRPPAASSDVRVHAVDRLTASRSALTSAAVLRIRSGDRIADARLCVAPERPARIQGRAAPTCGRERERPRSVTVKSGRDHPERIRGFTPRDHLDAKGRRRRGLRCLELEGGNQQEWFAVRRDREAGEPFKLLGVVAGHVAQSAPGVSRRTSSPLAAPRPGRGRGARRVQGVSTAASVAAFVAVSGGHVSPGSLCSLGSLGDDGEEAGER